MTTLTLSQAKTRWSSLIRRAEKGEEFGIITRGKMIQIKATDVVAWEDSYLFQEYGVTKPEWERFKKRAQARRKKEKYVEFKGKFDPKAFD